MPATPQPPANVQKSIAVVIFCAAAELAIRFRGRQQERASHESERFDLPGFVPEQFLDQPNEMEAAAGLRPGRKLSLFDIVGAKTGTPPDILRLLFLVILSTPLSLPFHRRIKKPWLIHIYSILTSVWFFTGVLDLKGGLFQLVAASLVTWALVRQGRGLAEEAKSGDSKTGKGRRMPWIVFGLMMTHLTVNHSIRIFTGIPLTKVEITGAHMVLVMKLTAFAWNAYDGGRPLDELDPYQQSQRIVKLPGLLEFMGYCLFFPSVLVGPAFSFAQYRAFSTGTLFSAAAYRGGLPPGRSAAANTKFVTGLVCLAIYGFVADRYSYETVLLPDFLEKPFVRRVVHLLIAGFMARTKYYLIWSFSEAAFAVSGAGYDATTQKWDAGKNVDIWALELAQNYKGVFDHWNMKTNIWLRECVYKRVAKKGRKPGLKSTLSTFATSALWHGPHPAYFLAFMMGGFLQVLGRHLRSSVRPLFLPAGSLLAPSRASSVPPSPAAVKKGVAAATRSAAKEKSVEPLTPSPPTVLKKLYDVASIVSVQLTLAYIVIPFLLVDVKASIEAYRRLHWYGHLATFVPLLFFWLGGGKFLKGLLRDRGEKDAEVEKYEQKVHDKLGVDSVNGINSVAPQLAVDGQAE